MNSVMVVIPVYNAPAHAENLLNDLYAIYGQVSGPYRFYLTDDGSSDPRVEALLRNHPFTAQPHVEVVYKKVNGGFVKNVNDALVQRGSAEHVIILNTDVRFSADFIKSLLLLADQVPNVASITPLSSNATLASLVNWPAGGQISEKHFKRIEQTLGNELFIDVPTGVGFCMLLSAAALDEVGIFNGDFGVGYGEEVEWCLRARRLGYRNLLSLSAFVGHIGTQSFSSEQKRIQQQRAEKFIARAYPKYELDISNHFYENSWRFYRLFILISAFSQKDRDLIPLIRILHGDPDSKHAGGTEQFVRRESESRSGGLQIELFPNKGQLTCTLFFEGERISSERFSFQDAETVMKIFELHQACLEVHHLLNWPAWTIELILRFRGTVEVYVHDFWFITPKVNLYHQDLAGVGLERTLTENSHHRQASARLFKKSLRIVAPSQDTKRWLVTFFPQLELEEKVQITKHNLSHLMPALALGPVSRGPAVPTKSIAFVGALHKHKGIEAIYEAIPRLLKKGYEVRIFGKLPAGFKNKLKVKIVPYCSHLELNRLLVEFDPALVGFNSLTPESFCYSFYEAILLSNAAVPVVSPLGNPAKEVREHELGVVADGFGPEDIVNAIDLAFQSHAHYLSKVGYWKTLYKSDFSTICNSGTGRLVSGVANFSAYDFAYRLIQQGRGEYKNPYLQNLFFKIQKGFYLADKVVERVPSLALFLRALLCLTRWVARLTASKSF